ncbi:MAG: C40 family peptidase [Desulfovibrionales bacterium]
MQKNAGPEFHEGPPGNGIVLTARSQIGTPYRWGGDSAETGFDCSGLIWWVYRQNGYSLPRMTSDQIRAGEPVDVLRPGDIVFFRISSTGSLHAGIYTGRGTFIHSPKTGGAVREDSMEMAYWRSRFLTARRILSI